MTEPCECGQQGHTHDEHEYLFGDIDIGHGVWISYVNTKAGNDMGIIETHPANTDTGRCSGAVFFEGSGHNGPLWTVESRDPLTLSPSLLCRVCGHHGFIKSGRWVPA